MWLGFLAGWIIGSASLYAYLVATAQEPDNQECLDCTLTDCSNCPYLAQDEESNTRLAA